MRHLALGLLFFSIDSEDGANAALGKMLKTKHIQMSKYLSQNPIENLGKDLKKVHIRSPFNLTEFFCKKKWAKISNVQNSKYKNKFQKLNFMLTMYITILLSP